jgi:hypothetical protein
MAAVTQEIFYLNWFGLGNMHTKSTNNAVKKVFQRKAFRLADPIMLAMLPETSYF